MPISRCSTLLEVVFLFVVAKHISLGWSQWRIITINRLCVWLLWRKNKMKNNKRYEKPALEFIVKKGLYVEYVKWFNSEGDKFLDSEKNDL